jgi:predicted AAA+ superfamily ATPase
MKDMKWKAKRPRDSSLNNEKAKELLREKSIIIIDEIKSLKGEINEYL